jgi:hypothetical protein
MNEQSNVHGISPGKLAANRRNGQKSKGPKTQMGKSRSRTNAIKHGILAGALLIKEGTGADDAAEFEGVLDSLHADLEPIGALEMMLVEKIAVCLWRQKRALRCEAGFIRRSFIPGASVLTDVFRAGADPERDAIKDHLYLPLNTELDRILRYETAIQRQLVYAINQLERMQRARKGDLVPAPLSVQLSEGM